MRDLELFGFVVSSPFRGTQVRKFTTEELLEIYPIRAALEGVAVAVCFPTTTHEVQTCIEIANRHGVPFVPRGSGTGLDGTGRWLR